MIPHVWLRYMILATSDINAHAYVVSVHAVSRMQNMQIDSSSNAATTTPASTSQPTSVHPTAAAGRQPSVPAFSQAAWHAATSQPSTSGNQQGDPKTPIGSPIRGPHRNLAAGASPSGSWFSPRSKIRYSDRFIPSRAATARLDFSVLDRELAAAEVNKTAQEREVRRQSLQSTAAAYMSTCSLPACCFLHRDEGAIHTLPN